MRNFLSKMHLMIIFILLIFVCRPNIAQGNEPIILSVQLMEFMETYLHDLDLTVFEAAHPNVEVNFIYKPFTPQSITLPPTEGLIEHLDIVDAATLEADIIMMSVGELPWLSVEATRAGYILDLAPLFNADSNADPSVYYPTIWQAAQWDGGLWMLPLSAQLAGFFYDAQAFDAAGLAYPNANWTFSEFANAVNVLATRNATGNVTWPGYSSYNFLDTALFYQALEQPPYDISQFPYRPQFLREDVLELANQWLPLVLSGAAFNLEHQYSEAYVNITPINLVPLQAMDTYLKDFELAPLPGGGAVVSINGLVVSARSQYPQLAYELASYLAADRLIAEAAQISIAGITLARPNYPDLVNEGNIPVLEVPPDAQTFVNDALENGIPASELLYIPYIQFAFWQVIQGELDIETALRDAEVLANNNLAIAEARRSEITGTIPTPVPEVALAEGEIELTFYYQEGDTLLWQAFADEFVANDPQVGRIILQSPSSILNYREEGTDCFYYNAYYAQAASEYFLDIAPLLAADASFNPDDWLRGVFNGVQKDNRIYALPIDIRPLALWYEPNQLEAFGLDAPQTSSELMNVLNVLSAGDSASLASYQLETSLLMLLASHDALPINFATNPVQIDFSSESNFGAIQEILDLARTGRIKYGSITDFSGDSLPEFEPLLLDYVSDSMFRDADYQPLPFPAGNQYTPVHYQTMAGYISRYTESPEACYRFLRGLSHRPDLLNGLPAQRSEAMRSDYATFYDSFNAQLNAPNLLIVPSSSDYYISYWLFRAFDRYVLEAADLLTELRAAEQFTNDYLLCVEAGTASDICARTVDSSLDL